MNLSHLVFIKVNVFIFSLSLTLESNDDKTHEDVDHEEGNDDNVDDVK